MAAVYQNVISQLPHLLQLTVAVVVFSTREDKGYFTGFLNDVGGLKKLQRALAGVALSQ